MSDRLIPSDAHQGEFDRLRQRVAELEQMVQQLTETLYQERRRFEHGPVVVVSWDERPGWPVSYVSSGIAQFGYTITDFISNRMSYLEFIHPDDRQRVLAMIDLLHVGNTSLLTRQEYRVICADGTVRYVLDFSRFVDEAAGSLAHIDGYLLDVTEQKQIEKALRQEELRFRQAARLATDSIYELDLRSGQVHLFHANAYPELLQQMDADITDAVWQQHLHPDDRERVLQARTRLINSDIPFAEEYRIVLNAPAIHYLFDRAVVFRNEQGMAETLLGVTTDITARKRIEEELRASQRFIQRIANTAPYMIYVFDVAKGCTTFINDYGLAFLGCTFDEVQQQGPMFFATRMHPDDYVALATYAQQWPEARDSQVFLRECRLKDAAGAWRWICSYEVVFQRGADGLPTEILGTAIDITVQKQSEAALRESEERYIRAVTAGQVGVWDWNLETNEIYLAPNLKAMLGYADHEIRNHLDDWSRYVHPDDWERAMSAAAAYLRGETPLYELEHRMLHKDGSVRWMIVRGSVVRDAAGRPVRMAGTDTDITERKQVEAALRESEAKFRSIVAQSTDGISLTDEHGRFIEWSPGMERITGLPHAAVVGHPAWEILYALLPTEQQTPEVYEQFRASVMAAATTGQAPWLNRLMEQDMQHPDGTRWYAQQHSFPINVNGRFLVCSIVRDLTERKQMELQLQLANERLQQQAIRDALTGLYNRRYLDETLPRELQRAARHQQPVTVMMLDIDHFKRFNDTYGHDAGDALLRAIGAFLKAQTRGDDIACRYGGEEFTLVLPGTALEHARTRAEQVRSGVQALVVSHRKHRLDHMTISLGIAVFPQHGDTADMLIQRADRALYQAKQAGRDSVAVARGHPQKQNRNHESDQRG